VRSCQFTSVAASSAGTSAVIEVRGRKQRHPRGGWMDGESQRSDRPSILRRRFVPHEGLRGGAGEFATGPYCHQRHVARCGAKAGDTCHPDRLLCHHRSSRTGLGLELGASRRQHHRFHLLRLPHHREMVGDAQGNRPGIRRTTFVFSPATAPWVPFFMREFGAVLPSLAVELSQTPVRDEAEIEAAVTAFAREPGGALIVAPDPFMNAARASPPNGTLRDIFGLPLIFSAPGVSHAREAARGVARCKYITPEPIAIRVAWRSTVKSPRTEIMKPMLLIVTAIVAFGSIVARADARPGRRGERRTGRPVRRRPGARRGQGAGP